MVLQSLEPWIRPIRLRTLYRLYSTDNSASGLFSDTLHLPKTDFPLRVDHAKSISVYRDRTSSDLYRLQWEDTRRPVFVLHDGPPYANGSLHMGHALNKILKDIINRYRVLRGYRVHYTPGWDCHGLPIENKALQELVSKTDSRQLSPTVIRDAAEKTAHEQILVQKEQFKQFGIMANWDSPSDTYRTLDHDYEMRQLRIFQRMVDNSLIYRKHKPVYYSPSSRSALAESELEYNEAHISHSVYVSFEIATPSEGLFPSPVPPKLLVWTSTPWTLTANMAIAVNPELTYTIVEHEESGARYIVASDIVASLAKFIGSLAQNSFTISGRELVGLRYRPLFGSDGQFTLPVIASSYVTPESGTGILHCAPAHGAQDYSMLSSEGIISEAQNVICHVNSGCFDASVAQVVGTEASARLIGQEVLTSGSKVVVDLVRERGQLVRVRRYKHKYPYDWRTKLPVITTATWQWFANLEKVKNKALGALASVQHIPPQASNRLEAFISSRAEWCISRQRVWGVPIPALHRVDTDEAVLDSASLDHILSVLDRRGTSYWWTGPVSEFVPPHLQAQGVEWRKGTDTMDVWFDSGTSWSMLDLPTSTTIASQNHVDSTSQRFWADVCLEGSDQHRGWFQSQLLTAIGSTSHTDEETRKIPYRTVITHGMVLDEKGTKMSKSLGNIVDPMVVVNGGQDKKLQPPYGPDILRLWAGTVDFTKDMSIGDKQLAIVSQSMRRIRNTARFALGNIATTQSGESVQLVDWKDMSLLDQYVMHKVSELEKTAFEGYESYDFAKVTTALNHFASITLSSLYFDVNKDCLYADRLDSIERRAVVTVLNQILRVMTNVLAPVMPHLAEEIHDHKEASGATTKPFFLTPWVPMQAPPASEQVMRDMDVLLAFRQSVLSLLENARREKLIRNSLEAEVAIICPEQDDLPDWVDVLRREESLLAKLFIVSDAYLVDEGSFGTTSPAWVRVGELELDDCEFAIQIRPATGSKCPRCWMYTWNEKNGAHVCDRCNGVLAG